MPEPDPAKIKAFASAEKLNRVPDMLNRAVGGLHSFTTNIGGYADWVGLPGTTKELYVRWSQAAVFTTHFRVHGSAFNGVRMPWFWEPDDPEPKAQALWKAAADLHVRARPLILELWQEAADTGMPITRPMWLHDSEAEGNPHNDDQWMLGPDLLAAGRVAQLAPAPVLLHRLTRLRWSRARPARHPRRRGRCHAAEARSQD